jgi:hypothetical protein
MRGATARTLFLLLLAVPASAGADWLVTRAGGRVETLGPWQIKGKLVVFKTPNGTLSSLRLADVDLAVSENATAEAKAAEGERSKAATEEPPKPERKKSVRSLTDADFSRKPGSADGTSGADGKAPAETKAGSDAGANKGRVEVSSWSQARRAEGDGIDLFGTLQNDGDAMATDIVIKVQLFNEAKESVGTAEAVLAMTSIPEGGTTSFRVPFSGVFAFTRAEFKVTSKTMTMVPVPP